MRLKYLFVYNVILIIITIGCNLYFTIKTHKEDVLLLTEDKFILTDKLLRENSRKRRYAVLTTVIVSFTLILNSFLDTDISFVIVEVVLTLQVILYLYKYVYSLFNYSFVEKQLIIKWVFDIVEDIEGLNLSKEESEKCYGYRVTQLILNRNLSTKKFNKVMKELESDLIRINEIGKED